MKKKKKDVFGISKISLEQRRDIADDLEGTSGCDDERTCEKYDIPMDELECIMADMGLERCEDCGWWCETGELVDDEGETAPCVSCRPHKDDDE